MASQSEQNYSCPICQEIFKDPVLLSCSHNFCKVCLQRWWTEKPTHECPLCRRKSSSSDPPQNLGLKKECKALLRQRVEYGRLHTENLRLKLRRINEAVQDNSGGHRELLKNLKETLELFNDYRGNFDQMAVSIEVQAEDTERQIKDVYLMLRTFLKREEMARIAALKNEKKKKSKMIKTNLKALNKDIETLSGAIRNTGEVRRDKDVSFQQSYSLSLMIDPEMITGAAIDTDKHLNNLAFNMLDRVKEMVNSSSLNPRTSDPEPTMDSLEESLSRLGVGRILSQPF